MRKDTKYIIIHCSATPPSMDIGAKDIDRWHRAKGWLGIGYHYVIKRDGTVEMGRKLEDAGAHAEGHNHHSVGVCMIGGIRGACPHCGGTYTVEDNHQPWTTKMFCGGCSAHEAQTPEKNFTPEQWAKLREVVRDLSAKYPEATVIGHNEVSAKACPSFDVQAWLKAEGSEAT